MSYFRPWNTDWIDDTDSEQQADFNTGLSDEYHRVESRLRRHDPRKTPSKYHGLLGDIVADMRESSLLRFLKDQKLKSVQEERRTCLQERGIQNDRDRRMHNFEWRQASDFRAAMGRPGSIVLWRNRRARLLELREGESSAAMQRRLEIIALWDVNYMRG